MRIGIIGAGISGIVAAHTLAKEGHETLVFEKSTDLGGVWALGYPGVRLQNTAEHYCISDLPWPFAPDRHPTSAQIRSYLNFAVERLKLNVRRGHEVTQLRECDDGWVLAYRNEQGEGEDKFDFIVVAIGQYSEGKNQPRFPGQEDFKGEVITERDVYDLEVFKDKEVVIVGFGKSAVDMATFAVERAKQVHHVFRTPRWMIPFHILGIHYSHLMFCRLGSMIMPCWDYPDRFQAFLHRRMVRFINAVWKLVTLVISLQCKWLGVGKGPEIKAALGSVIPGHNIVGDLRSAAAMAPENYFNYIAAGKIRPRHAALKGFNEEGLVLAGGATLACEQVVLCLGSKTPRFPFFPEKYRRILEAENDGIQLYRHLLHPKISNLAFAGFNHGFMHVPAVEVAMLWLSACLRKELELPSVKEMEQSMRRVLAWKRHHINFEPSRSCAVNTRYQQYIDIMLNDLGLSPWRKMPNLFAELFSQYGALDYRDLGKEYRKLREGAHGRRRVQLLDT